MSETSKFKVPIIDVITYPAASFIGEYLWGVFGAFVLFFYETEIGLDVGIVALAFSIYAIWDAVNDPLVGYFSDRPSKLARKFGRRYPWILVGLILWIASTLALFNPPNVNPNEKPWLLFTYLLITICLFDTFYTMAYVNIWGLFPDKFRSDKQRRNVTTLNVVIGVFGIFAGALIPPMLLGEYGNVENYQKMAIVSVIICAVLGVLALIGTRENRVMIEEFFEHYAEKSNKESFFGMLKKVLTNRNFMAFTIFYFTYQLLTKSLVGSLNYLIKYELGDNPDAFTLIMIGYLVGTLLSMPIWWFVAQKTNDDRKMMILGGILMTLGVVPLIFVNTLLLVTISVAIIGIGIGAFWFMIDVTFAHTMDEILAREGVKQESSYQGIYVFLARMATIIQVVSLALVHKLTGFDETLPTQPPSALFGIRIHMAIIPILFMIFGILWFVKKYDLTPQKIEEIQLKIKEREESH